MNKGSWKAASSIVCAALALLGGCSSIDVESNRFLGAPTYPATNPDSVQILQRPPERPYERLAQIIVEPSGSPELTEMEQKVRAAAAQLGADAVIVEYDGTRMTGWSSFGPRWSPQGYVQYGRVIVTVAIHYTGG